MFRVEADTTFIGLSELRKEIPNLLQEIQQHKVILTKRNQPVGVIVNYNEYKKLEEIFEQIEDLSLGSIANNRAKRKNKRLLSLKEAEQLVGLR